MDAVASGAATRVAILTVCGTLAACTGPERGPALSPNATNATNARQDTEQTAGAGTTVPFATLSVSPQPVLEVEPDLDARALSLACGESDAALRVIARGLAEQQTETQSSIDADALTASLRAEGAPYVWPRAWLFSGSAREVWLAKQRMQAWLASFSDGGVRRCGVALLRRAGGRISVGAVAVDALADLEPLPTQVRVGQWLDLRATVRVATSAAKLVVMGPHGAPHAVPTSFNNGRVRARFNADQPGAWLVQLLGVVEGGPRPLLEALVFAGSEPGAWTVGKAPGEELARSIAEPTAALYAMLDAARSSEGLPLLTRDPRLERLAQAHAEAMRRAHKTAHDAGDGDLNQRLEQLGLELRAGENVAHAASAAQAQRALWGSPSHRENLLFPSFDRVGVGVSLDADGTLWVCQVFASRQ